MEALPPACEAEPRTKECPGQYVPDAAVLDLISGYLRRVVAEDGVYEEICQGISLGCPLSPLMGALFWAEFLKLFLI